MKPKPNFGRIKKAILRQGQPDRVPLYEHLIDTEIIEAVLGEKISNIDRSTKTGKELFLKKYIKFFYDLGYDNIPWEVPLNFPRDNILAGKDTATGSRDERQWADENKGVISTMEDFEKYPWPKNDDCADFLSFEILSRILPDGMKVIGGIGGGIFEQVEGLMGLVPLSMALYDNPELIEAMFKKTSEYRIYADNIIYKFSCMGIGRMGDDMGFKTSTMLPPDVLRKYVFPWQKKAVEAAHKHSLPFLLHSCGNLKEIMNDLIDDVKIDGKHSWEDAITPVVEAKKLYGSRIAVFGGADVDFLCRRNEDEIRKYCRNILEKCAPGGGYAFGSGNSVPNYVPVKNYLIMVDECHKFNG